MSEAPKSGGPIAPYWQIKNGDKVLGPYTFGQLRSLAQQGRAVQATLACPIGKRDWQPMSEIEAFKDFFTYSENTSSTEPEPEAPAKPQGPKKRLVQETTDSIANFILILELKGASRDRLSEKIVQLGRANEVFPDVWLLSAPLTVGAVRNALTPFLGPMDSLFVVDASHDKLAWFNLGPQMDSKIRSVWKKTA